MNWPRFSSGQPTHVSGEHGVSPDYAILLEQERKITASQAKPISAPIIWLAIAPLSPWLARIVVELGVSDQLVEGRILLLWAVALAAVVLAGALLEWPAKHFPRLRDGIAWLGIIATLCAAIGYVIVGLMAYAQAHAGHAERTFVVGGEVLIFQRSDGSTFKGQTLRNPVTASRQCALVQPLTGKYGFRWLRILESSPPPGPGQLAWPITRDECFSARPLVELGRS